MRSERFAESDWIDSRVCPLCGAWGVCVALVDVPWPQAGELVEAAIAEHVDADLARFNAGREQTR